MTETSSRTGRRPPQPALAAALRPVTVVAAATATGCAPYLAVLERFDLLASPQPATTPAFLTEPLQTSQPRLLVLHDSFPGVLAAARWAVSAGVAVVVVTADKALAATTLAQGVAAWSRPDAGSLTRVVSGLLAEHGIGPGGEPAAAAPTLPTREREILEQLASGASNAEIAAQLYLSEETVRTYVKRLLRSMKARNRTHAVTVAYRAGLVG